MTPMLSILCVTKAEPYTIPFLRAMAHLARGCVGELVIAADGEDARLRVDLMGLEVDHVVTVKSAGYIESVLDQANDATRGEYILRLDDDERANIEMIAWLRHGSYTTANHWKFNRAHLWPDAHHYIPSGPLWPDHQTRLSVRAFAGGRYHMHAGSPYGGGVLAPGAIEHHKFLVRTLEERRALVAHRESIQPGTGAGGFAIFNCPEDVIPDVSVERWGHGEAA